MGLISTGTATRAAELSVPAHPYRNSARQIDCPHHLARQRSTASFRSQPSPPSPGQSSSRYAGSSRRSGGLGAPPSAGRPVQVSRQAGRPHCRPPTPLAARQAHCPSFHACRPQHFACAAPQRRAAGRQLAVSVRAEGARWRQWRCRSLLRHLLLLQLIAVLHFLLSLLP